MDLNECHNNTMLLMAEHGLDTPSGWRFKFDGSKRRFGSCSWTNKTITLSRHLVGLNTWDEVKKTVLHEIAHALTPEAQSSRDLHGIAWQNKCIELGLSPSRCYDMPENGRAVIKVTAPYVGYCANTSCRQHTQTWKAFRKVKRICRLCRTKIDYRYPNA